MTLGCGLEQNARAGTRHRAGRRQRRRADVGLHESRGPGGDSIERPGDILEPQQKPAMDQG